MSKEYPVIDTPEALEAEIARVKAAQEIYATYTQEQVDKIFLAAATAANKARIPLAKAAVAETGMGIVEDKVIKNHFAAEYIYNAYRDTKTCGVIEEDTAYGVRKIAEPIGLVCAIIPTTNPTSTAIFKTLLALKTRNGIIISPHHRAKSSTVEAAKVVLEAAVEAGAPEDIIGWISAPSREMTRILMKESDIILATGGPSMVNAAYSSGTPALGVGAGNVPAIIDDTADVLLAVNSVIHSKTFDNGMICASEQSVVVLDGVYEQVRREFAARGCYFLRGEELDKVRKTIIINGSLNAGIVGQSAAKIAALSGVEVPEGTKILIGEVESTGKEEEFAHEKLSPVLAMYRAKDFADAVDKADALVRGGGLGHTSSIYLDTAKGQEKLAAFQARMKTCRIVVNTPSSHGGIGDLYNFALTPSLTLGCGSWGGNSVSENVGVKQLLNIKTVVERRENMLWFRAPEKIYIKKGCLPVALNELKDMGKKRAFVVTGPHLHKTGAAAPIFKKLEELGIEHTCFFDVPNDPTLACAREGAKQMSVFKPDVIIALGGGSPMDTAKAIGFMTTAGDRKINSYMHEVIDMPVPYLVAIPTTAGTGSEVTKNTIISDTENNVKMLLGGPSIIPALAVVDPTFTMTAPPGVTAATGIDALCHAIEAYTSRKAQPLTDTFAISAIQKIHKNLPICYKDGKNEQARLAMSIAALEAGIAFNNASVTIVHGMSRPIGALFHIAHGVSNAVLLPACLEFAIEENTARFAHIGRIMGVADENTPDHDAAVAMVKEVERFCKEVGIPPVIELLKKGNHTQEEFFSYLDKMASDALESGSPQNTMRIPTKEQIIEIYKKLF